MHTAFEIKNDMLALEVDGAPVGKQDVLDWGPQDRLGVVIDEPYGALGAGLMISLAILAFYDMPGKKRRQRPIYPEIHLFHVGGPWGVFIAFDFFPHHKEVFLPEDRRALLPAINSRAITHLLVPQRNKAPITHRFKEPEAAKDRIKQCFAYDPRGLVEGSDVRISTSSDVVLANFRNVVRMDDYMSAIASSSNPIPLRLRATDPEENGETFQAVVDRLPRELRRDDPLAAGADERIAEAIARGRLDETYRRISTDEALSLL